ncbi:hypothetical protein BDQ17DRAFT_1435880 [Cyathus striatus]|nr:hypothetical protein BDQ17DRAFT_1435880 [Cyathus striatus]
MSTTSLANTTHSPSSTFSLISTTYKPRSESHSFFTHFVCFATLLLVLNDIGEYIWGWADDGLFSILISTLRLIEGCADLNVDMRDAIGDTRLMLSGGFRRDGTKFDVGEAITLKEYAQALSASQVLSQSRKSRGFFSILFRSSKRSFKPTYTHKEDSDSCRIFGALMAKCVREILHITTLGHGYASYEHVDHNSEIFVFGLWDGEVLMGMGIVMNLSHIMTEFSFGPLFPEMVQPLDSSFEVMTECGSGKDKSEGLVAAQVSGTRVGLRAKWAGGELRSRGKAGGSALGSPWYGTGSDAESVFAFAECVCESDGDACFGPGSTPGPFSPMVEAGSGLPVPFLLGCGAGVYVECATVAYG